MQTGPRLFPYASAIIEQKKFWELLAEEFDRFKTLRNSTQHYMQLGVEMVATCNPFARALEVQLRKIYKADESLKVTSVCYKWP